MEGLKNKKFKAIDWARNSRTVEGSLTVRDYKTLEPASKESNHNGYVVCIENEDGVHIVSPDSVELVD
jgi:hypothetical protein